MDFTPSFALTPSERSEIDLDRSFHDQMMEPVDRLSVHLAIGWMTLFVSGTKRLPLDRSSNIVSRSFMWTPQLSTLFELVSVFHKIHSSEISGQFAGIWRSFRIGTTAYKDSKKKFSVGSGKGTFFGQLYEIISHCIHVKPKVFPVSFSWGKPQNELRL